MVDQDIGFKIYCIDGWNDKVKLCHVLLDEVERTIEIWECKSTGNSSR